MALPKQLKAARAVNGTAANTIDNVIGELEGVLCDILGFTIDLDVTVSPFSFNNSGQITKALVAQRAAGPVGWRLRDTTTGAECRLAVSGTNFVIDENTGTEDTPIWTNRFSMVLGTGVLTGSLATSARMGLCPAGDGVATHFLNGQFGWTEPAAATSASVRLRNSANQSIPTSSTTTLSFDTEDFDTDSMHAGSNPSRITATTAGKYLVIGQVSFASNAAGNRTVQIVKNSGLTLQSRVVQPACASANTSLETRALVEMAAGDYVQLQVIQSSGGALNAVAAASYAPVFSAVKVG
jgi:hypothetical protein